MTKVFIRNELEKTYKDIYTTKTLNALAHLSKFNSDQKKMMAERNERRLQRIRQNQKITFLNPDDFISRTNIKVKDARDGKFIGSEIPVDLQRQWVQGTGPGAKPNSPVEQSIRNIAYALLSGADGWMFDGEDALGQVTSMSLDNQRNLKLAIRKDPLFLKVSENVSKEMNKWSEDFFGRRIIEDWKEQLGFTTKIFRVRGLHLDDRHIRIENGIALSASIVDLTLYVVNNYQQLIKVFSTYHIRSYILIQRFTLAELTSKMYITLLLFLMGNS